MKYQRMPIEIESPEEYGYDKIKYNLSESSISDQSFKSLGLEVPNLTLLYNEHRGSIRLRELIAANSGLDKDDVLITSGAAGALFIISTSQLSQDDHLVVIRPNYATNLETPKAIGCDITFVDLDFNKDFEIDVDFIAKSIKSNTKIVSVTCPHNPTGTVMSRTTLDRLVAVTKEKGCLLLVDETYKDIHFGSELPIAASLGDHVLSVASLSKSYGVPGIRIGWVVTQNKQLQETFLAAKEQISISGSVIDEWIAEQILADKASIISKTTTEMKARLDVVSAWIEKEELLEWVRPAGGVVCFPRMKKEPVGGTAVFYERLLNKYHTYIGPGHWFEMPDTYFRIGFGWPTRDELEAGLKAISQALRDS
ncbi:aminotransferase class I and II [Colletotrichum truncatum]|uniref:Aminotransferase class I and II n=1 Tax=Colletotrichum truncatum TaxID=5467 RepID=A0ACC3YYR2_COLTU|nr:aminotransferase class I and II [Colletotrichum truncatum]KAF6781823.1 aminotransferase class I and II [Colletotrichum truncatum]